MNIVYLVFGESINNYQQVYFSIYTALLHKEESDRIIVLAEAPSLFEHFGTLIEVITITRAKINEWEGEYSFFWRVKIKALELVFNKYPADNLLYLDGDTFIYKSLSDLNNEMNDGQNFMHLNEGKMMSLSTKTEKLMWKQIKEKSFGNIIIDNEVAMWNAGLIGISKAKKECLDLVLKINDEMCAHDVTRRLIEQLSFSIGLNQYSNLKPADHVVGHYWGNKEEWNKIIEDFLLRNFMKNSSLKTILDEVSKMPLKEYPIWTRHSNTQRKLKRFIDSFYKDRRAQFVK